MHSVDLDELQRRPERYMHIDGLPDLIMGGLWMLWGGAWLFGRILPHDWRWTAYWSAVTVLLVVVGLGVGGLLARVKSRVTFPRTGYVDWKAPSSGQRLAAAAAAVIVGSVLVMTAGSGSAASGQLAAPAFGVILGLVFVFLSIRQRARRYLALAAVALGLGAGIGMVHRGWPAVSWLLVGVGGASAVAGGVRLIAFLKRHPRV